MRCQLSSQPAQPLRSLAAVGLLLLLPACGGGLPPVETTISPSEPAVAELVRSKVDRVLASPGDAAAHGSLGLAYEANGLWEEAEACFANAAALDPNEVLWSYHQALALQEMGRTDDALALLRLAAASSGS